MHRSNGSAPRNVDWREWVAFLGYVLATSVVVSVALASVVLLLSTQADDTAPGLEEPPRLQAPRPAPTMLRQGPAAGTEPRPAQAPGRQGLVTSASLQYLG